MTKENHTIAIFLATHVKFTPPDSPIYIPLHVGREGKKDLGYLADNIGDNISDLNYLFGELTGLYWIWQNIRDIDYVGLCHYRRYFLNDYKRLMQREEYLDILAQYDAIVPTHAECKGSYYERYGRAHDARYLDVIGNAIKKICPEYYESFNKAMQGNIFFAGNLMVSKLSVLKDYSEWLFTIFMEVIGEIDVSGYDDYHKRVYGFLSEQMLYVYMMKNNLRYRETIVGISGEKAETHELKEALKGLMAEGKYEEAVRLFNKKLEERPDVLLSGSDLYGELRAIDQQLKEKFGYKS